MKNIRIFAGAIRGVVQLASILAWGASGRPFESGHSDAQQKSSRFLCCFFGIVITLSN